jgi:hypothetical protein
MPAGYSGTPLLKKLGLAPPMTLVSIDAPREYRTWLGKLPNGVSEVWSGLKLVIRKSERLGAGARPGAS